MDSKENERTKQQIRMKNQNGEILFKKFEIIKCIKKDAYSAVYLANHIYLEKKVFIKILDTEAIPDPNIVSRFKLEAKILAKLEHPNIIKVYDFGMFQNHFYISFEFFESQNLREFLKNRKIDEVLSLDILMQIVHGLDFAHQQKIIHRDIKPENILINSNNMVKITDFGLAVDIIENIQTKKYSVVGTPAYMSPEQVIGEKLSSKSDLFSLGLTALEIFGFRNPFWGKDTSETINKIISYDQDEFENLLSEIPERHKQLFKGLLAVNQEERFESCSDILNLLGTESKSYETESSKNRRVRWIFIVIGIITAIGILYLIIFIESASDEMPDNKTEDRLLHEINNFDSSLFTDTVEQTILPKRKNINEKITKLNNLAVNSPGDKPTEIKISDPKNLEMSKLFVECYPWGKIYLNDVFIDTTPLITNLEVEPGKYTMKIIHPGYPIFSDSLNLLPGKLSKVNVNLDTLFGYLSCYVFPWGKIIIDGEEKGITPLESPIILNEGIHTLSVINENFNSFSTNINIVKKDTLTLKINLSEMSMK